MSRDGWIVLALVAAILVVIWWGSSPGPETQKTPEEEVLVRIPRDSQGDAIIGPIDHARTDGPVEAVVKEQRDDEGTLVALRLELGGGGQGTCGHGRADLEWVETGRVTSDGKVPIYVADKTMDCSVRVLFNADGPLIWVNQPAAPNPFTSKPATWPEKQ